MAQWGRNSGKTVMVGYSKLTVEGVEWSQRVAGNSRNKKLAEEGRKGFKKTDQGKGKGQNGR